MTLLAIQASSIFESFLKEQHTFYEIYFPLHIYIYQSPPYMLHQVAFPPLLDSEIREK